MLHMLRQVRMKNGCKFSMVGLSAVLERVRLIKGIGNTETSILLATYR